MRLFVFFILIFSLVSPVASAAMRQLDVVWDCPQTVKSEVPFFTHIKLGYDPETGSVNHTELKDFLESAEKKSPEIDFFDCAVRFMNQVEEELRHDLQASKVNLGEGVTSEKIRYRFWEPASAYGARSYSRGALPPIEPLKKQYPGLSLDDRSELLDHVVESCVLLEPSSLYLDERILVELIGRSSKLDKNCKETLERDLAEVLASTQLDSKQCAKFPVPCATRRHSLSLALALLKPSGLASYISKEAFDSVAACSDFNDPTSAKPALELFKFCQDTQLALSAQACVPLDKENDFAVINGDSGTGVSASYLIRRLKDKDGKKSYEAVIDYKFVDRDYKLSDELTAKMRKQVIDCFKNGNSRMKGENGESLVFRLAEPGETPVPATVSITVSPTIKRASPGGWNPKIDCSTVLHETGHVMGLSDEYLEEDRGFKVEADGSYTFVQEGATLPDSDCRSVAPEDSLMNICEYAYDRRVPKTNKKGESYDSLFYAGEFRAITHPGCADINRMYYLCSGEWMSKSPNAYGTGRCSVSLPKECSNPAEWVK